MGSNKNLTMELFIDTNTDKVLFGEAGKDVIDLLIPPPSTKRSSTVNAVDGREGYVKGVFTYTVMDDLTITPMTATSIITLLSNLNVKDRSALTQKVVTLDSEKGLELLRCSLQSKTVLTDVFLAVKKE